MRLAIVTSHPIQCQAPLFRRLADFTDIEVLFAARATPHDQAAAGFGIEFDWDIDLLSGYKHRFLRNLSLRRSPSTFWGTHCPELFGLLHPERYDAALVMGWHILAYWEAVIAGWRNGVPLIFRGVAQLQTDQSRPQKTLKKIIYPNALRKFAAACYVGKRNYEYLLAYGGDRKSLFFSPHCVDNVFFRRTANKIQLKAQEERDALYNVMFCGKLIGKKRPLDLLKAVRKCSQDIGNLKVTIVGSGPLEGELREYSRRHNLCVHFAGFQNQSEIARWYAQADLLVLPSDGTETWGLVVNEAMACGTPAVVSDAVGCAPDLIEPGLTGEVYPMGDTTALAEAIRRMLGRKQLPEVQRALQRKMEIYSIERAAAGILEAAEYAIRKRQENNS